MSRLSIDVTPEQHKRLKALAALQGLTIKQYVLLSTLGSDSAGPALAELEALLDRRAKRSEDEGVSSKSVEQIFRQAKEDLGADPDA